MTSATEMATGECSAYGGFSPVILGVVWLEMVMATILIALRLYVGLLVKKPLGWDFFWATVALVSDPSFLLPDAFETVNLSRADRSLRLPAKAS